MFGFSSWKDKYIAGLEAEIAFWRDRAETERSRADRLHDSLLVQAGQLPVTDTVRAEDEKARLATANQATKYALELKEMFAEESGEMERYDGIELPDGLKADAAQMFLGETANMNGS